MNDLTILLENNYTNKEFAFQLTAYEKWGCIDFEDACYDLLVSNYLEEAETSDLVYMWNEYCQENNYDDEYFSNDDYFFEEFFNGCEPMRIVQATYFGDYRYMDDWVKFNGYGNLNSYSDWQVKKEIKENNDFLQWCFENVDIFEELREEENRDELVKMALELVKEGY